MLAVYCLTHIAHTTNHILVESGIPIASPFFQILPSEIDFIFQEANNCILYVYSSKSTETVSKISFYFAQLTVSENVNW